MMVAGSDSESSICGYDPTGGEWIVARKSKKKASGKSKTKTNNSDSVKDQDDDNGDCTENVNSECEVESRSVCGKCDRTVESNASGLKCDICLEPFHAVCTHMSERTYNAITDLKLFWICCKCESFKTEFQEVVAKGKTKTESDRAELKDTLKAIERSVESLAAAITSQRPLVIEGFTSVHESLKKSSSKSNLADIEERVKNVIQSEKALYSDMVKRLDAKVSKMENRETSYPGEQVKSAMIDCMQQERRRKNVVIHGLPEPEGGLRTEDKAIVDQSNVEEILAKILDQKTQVIRTYRVGKAREAKPKLLVVELQEEREKWKVLKAAPRLRSLGNEFKFIYISPDLTPEEQRKARALRTELAERKAKGEDVMIVKGRIISREKKELGRGSQTPKGQSI